MAFAKLTDWVPNLKHIDPRIYEGDHITVSKIKRFYIENLVNPATETKIVEDDNSICFYINGETKFVWYGLDPRIYDK